MLDSRVSKLADILVHFSCKVQKGEKVYIDLKGVDHMLGEALVKEVFKAGGLPYIRVTDNKIHRQMMLHLSREQMDWLGEEDARLMVQCACYIGVRGFDNAFELSDVPDEQNKRYDHAYFHRVHEQIRIPKTRWVVLRYPTPAMAQLAGMSTQAFEDYYFKVCTLDYQKMDKAMDALKKRMESADQVRITGRDTDLRFSIKGQSAIKCAGHLNIPDGEIYTSPIKNSVEGRLTYNTPSLYQGVRHENISFTFKNGKIIKATGSQEELLNQILDSDEGARFIGEFAIGVNPYITKPMLDTLFDEKITGSFHFTPGMCYDNAPNGNKSVVHWDLVMIQTPEYGGGEMYFDGELIRKDGLFVPDDLQCLNPEVLKN